MIKEVLQLIFLNRPDKFYQNSPERYLKTTGAFTKGQTPQTFILKSTSRSKSKQVVGAPAPVSNIKPSKTPNFKKSTRNNYKSIGVLNKTLTDGWNEKSELSDYGKKGIKLPANERDVTQKRTHVLNVIDLVKSITAHTKIN